MGFYDSALYKQAKESEHFLEELPYKKKPKKAPVKKADHKHTYVEYIEAESESLDAKLHKVTICTQCGKHTEDPMIFHKTSGQLGLLLIITLGQALAQDIPVVIKGQHLFGKAIGSDGDN